MEGVNTQETEEYYSDVVRHIDENLDPIIPLHTFHLACALYCTPNKTHKHRCELLGIQLVKEVKDKFEYHVLLGKIRFKREEYMSAIATFEGARMKFPDRDAANFAYVIGMGQE
jgi:hypothetical protein